jgi:transposase
MLHTGIDKHKDNSFLTTVNDEGTVVRQERLKNTVADFTTYLRSFGDENQRAVVESTTGWYWLDDLLTSLGVELILAHAKYLKAIAYAKVKTDKIDSETLAQLLRMNYIPQAHKIAQQHRAVRDLMRARLRMVWKRTSCYNSLHRIGEKFNCDPPVIPQENVISEEVPDLYREQVALLNKQIEVFNEQITHVEHLLQNRLLDTEDIQRLLWVPAFGRITAFSVYLEIDGIERFDSDRKFFSYARVVPGADNSNHSRRHKSGSKDGNKYLKIALTDAAVHAVRYYPEIRAFCNKMRRRSNEAIARTLVAKELARIVYHILKNKTPYRGFKGQPIQRHKTMSWPRRVAFAPVSASVGPGI